MKRKKWMALLAALALALSLLAGCGGQTPQPDPDQPPAPPAGLSEPAPPPAEPAAPSGNMPEKPEKPEKPEEPEEPEEPAAEPAENPASEPPAGEETPVKTAEDPAPDPPEAAPEVEPVPEPDPEPEPEGESVRAGDTYTISVTLEGGSGRASVESPAKLRYDETGKCWATIVWSSPNFDYMKVDGLRYDPINTEGNSTFEILVSAFDTPLPIIADTVAMSEPHEVEYTLTFDYASMEDA